MIPARPARWPLVAEWIGAIGVVATLILNMYKLFKTGGQPQPYFFYINDVFADWFNTAQYSRLPGAYDVWRSIYPPISFVFLHIFSRGVCYESYGMEMVRDCDWIGRWTLFAGAGLCCLVAWRSFRNMDRRTMWPRTIAFSCGLPLWYGLERGQLLLITFPFLALAHGPLRVRSLYLRWICSAIAINFKPYMLAGVAADVVRHRWLAAEIVTLLVAIVYIVTWAIFGGGDPLTVVANIQKFNENFSGGGWGEIYYASTYKSLIVMLTENPVARLAIGSHLADVGATICTVLMRLSQGMIALALVAAYLSPRVASRVRLAGLAMGLAIITTLTGGYSMFVIVYFAFLEPAKGPGRMIAIFSAYILCLQVDWVLSVVTTVYQPSYFFGGYAQQSYGIGVGVFLRPGLVVLIECCIAGTVIVEFVRLWREAKAAERDATGPAPAGLAAAAE